MNLNDLQRYQDLLRERADLLRFTHAEFSAKLLGVFIPTLIEETFRCHGEGSFRLLFDDKSTIDAMMALALPAAKARLAEIEAQLSAAGIEFSAAD